MTGKRQGAFVTGDYPDLLKRYGYEEAEIAQKLLADFDTMFFGSEEERIYHEAGEDMGYLEDTGNHDVRTEGMSYGMMVCVQMDRKDVFDRIWKWARTYMYMETGDNAGYFAWSCAVDGSKNADGPAPDGEEYFAMALFFASHRWGDGEGIFCYSEQAKQILRDCIHKGEDGIGQPMWHPQNHLIKFVPGLEFSDPSYHLPHFYELFSLWADEADSAFWKQAAKASRAYLQAACHPQTGLCAEYAEYDGTPCQMRHADKLRHDWYYSDAYRTIANIGLDWTWFAADTWQPLNARKLQQFYMEQEGGDVTGVYELDGTRVEAAALHPVAVIAVNAQSVLAWEGVYAKELIDRFWETGLRKGNRRYYDNFLYLFAMLALSGNYRIW